MRTCSECGFEVESMVELAEHLLLSHDGEKQIRKEPARWFDTFMNVWRVQFDCLVCEKEASYKEGDTPIEFCYSCERAVKYGESREQERIFNLIYDVPEIVAGETYFRGVYGKHIVMNITRSDLEALIKGENK